MRWDPWVALACRFQVQAGCSVRATRQRRVGLPPGGACWLLFRSVAGTRASVRADGDVYLGRGGQSANVASIVSERTGRTGWVEDLFKPPMGTGSSTKAGSSTLIESWPGDRRDAGGG